MAEGLALRKMNREEIAEKQLGFLRAHLRHAATTPFYQRRFADCALVPDEIGSIADLAQIPLTSRADLDGSPELFGLRDESRIRDIALTSGTTGNAIMVPYTEADLERIFFNEMMAYHSAGVLPEDRVLLTVTIDRCFVAGLAYYQGAVSLGASVIRSGPGQFARQWELIDTFAPRVIVGVPTFLRKLALWGVDNGRDPASCSVDTLVTIGEPGRRADCTPNTLGGQLIELWQARLHSSYGATEQETAFGECAYGCGGHVHPELMLVEIVDEEGRVLPEGEPGEVVSTPLGVEGFPLVRFRTGDISRLHNAPCACGWNTSRLGPIEGRLAQRLKCKGTVLYPESIFNSIQHLPHSGVYVEVRAAADGADLVTVVVGQSEPLVGREHFLEALQAHLRMRPEVVLKDPEAVLAQMTGDGGRKPRKFFDFREG